MRPQAIGGTIRARAGSRKGIETETASGMGLGIVPFGAGLWLVMSLRHREAWVGSACLLAAAYFIATDLPDIVHRYARTDLHDRFGRATSSMRRAVARRMHLTGHDTAQLRSRAL